MCITVRVLIFVSLAIWYQLSSDGTNSPWYEQSRRLRIVHGMNSPSTSTVQTVQGTNSPAVADPAMGGPGGPPLTKT